MSRKLAWLILCLPLLTLLVIVAHSSWNGAPEALQRDQDLFAKIGLWEFTLTPSALPPRQGSAPHRAVDTRHAPWQPVMHFATTGQPSLDGRP